MSISNNAKKKDRRTNATVQVLPMLFDTRKAFTATGAFYTRLFLIHQRFMSISLSQNTPRAQPSLSGPRRVNTTLVSTFGITNFRVMPSCRPARRRVYFSYIRPARRSASVNAMVRNGRKSGEVRTKVLFFGIV